MFPIAIAYKKSTQTTLSLIEDFLQQTNDVGMRNVVCPDFAIIVFLYQPL